LHDLLIRGGVVVDGTGALSRTADIAVADGRIAEVGRVTGPARETIDADGALVTPGFIDIHTHYDGQFLWDDAIEPSVSHGVTTAIGGNCGMGFAPYEPGYRQQLIELMEGVEDIPGVVLDVGLDWDWRSFGDYLDRLDARRYTMDVASHLPHAPLRVAVMGERALRHEAATADDVAAMQGHVRAAMAAGAVGVSANRLLEHLTSAGAHVPGTFAEDDELIGLATAMAESGRGTFQVVPLGAIGSLFGDEAGRQKRKEEHDRIGQIARACGRPVTYTLLQYASDLDDWRMMLDETDRLRAEGVILHPQVAARPGGLLLMLDGYHPFRFRPSYLEVAALPQAERALALRDPARRAAILAEADVDAAILPNDRQIAGVIRQRLDKYIPLTHPPVFEPDDDRCAAAEAARAGVTVEAYLYDFLTAGDGSNVFQDIQFGYPEGNLNALREMLANPLVVTGLGDGGAHLSMICDASMPTSQLMFWARDRVRGARLPLEDVVAKLTKANADLYGLGDRGAIEVGRRADINVIDFENLTLDTPRMHHDLPTGGKRILQGARGYLATLVNGVVTRRNDADTSARPGRLVRAGQ
jgi:N-acyl-D-aspartate/D-glutamate deacylase